MVKVVGVDLSLTSTGLALVTGPGASTGRVTTKPTGPDVERQAERLWTIARKVSDWTRGADLVVLEGPSHGSNTGSQHERAGLWWIVATRLIGTGYPVAVVPPACRAKYATGKGNAGKDRVLAAVIHRYPQVDVDGNDQADALILAAMGARHLGHPIDTVPVTHLTAMAGSRWPDPPRTLL